MELTPLTHASSVITRLFPFHLGMDKDMIVRNIGKGVLKITGETILNQSFLDHFDIRLPRMESLSFQDIASRQKAAFLIEEKNSRRSFRGEFLIIGSGDEMLAYFVGSPILREIEALKEFNLKVNDFALYDAVPDFLFLLQGQKKTAEQASQLSKNLLRQKSQLEKKNEELQQFAYVVSHDLKAPLRAISSLVTFLEEDLDPKMTEDDREKMVLLTNRVRRMENLINGILEYSRADRTRSEKEEIDLNVLVRELGDSLEKGHERPFGIQVPDPLPTIHASRIKLSQVFLNLISNAIKYNDKDHCEITVTCKENNGVYTFAIRDNGPGIEEQYREKIFRIFQTLQAKDHFESTGIGLSIVKKLVESEGKGTIFVDSVPGESTSFIFTWDTNE